MYNLHDAGDGAQTIYSSIKTKFPFIFSIRSLFFFFHCSCGEFGIWTSLEAQTGPGAFARSLKIFLRRQRSLFGNVSGRVGHTPPNEKITLDSKICSWASFDRFKLNPTIGYPGCTVCVLFIDHRDAAGDSPRALPSIFEPSKGIIGSLQTLEHFSVH